MCIHSCLTCNVCFSCIIIIYSWFVYPRNQLHKTYFLSFLENGVQHFFLTPISLPPDIYMWEHNLTCATLHSDSLKDLVRQVLLYLLLVWGVLGSLFNTQAVGCASWIVCVPARPLTFHYHCPGHSYLIQVLDESKKHAKLEWFFCICFYFILFFIADFMVKFP